MFCASLGNNGKGHPHVLRLLDHHSFQQYNISVLEYAAHGEFYDIIAKCGAYVPDSLGPGCPSLTRALPSLPNEVAAKYFRQVAGTPAPRP